MRAIIDASGLGAAGDYYTMFPREPAATSGDDMTISTIDRVRNITMLALLDRMLVASGNGETEVLIVAHGEARGFLMPIAPGGVSAMKDALRVVIRVAPALDRRDEIRRLPAGEQLSAWTDLLNELAPGSITGTITVAEAERFFEQQWLRAQAQSLRVDAATLQTLVARMKSVQDADFQRVEVRACNIGQDTDALDALKEFLGADRVCAPNVGTFYVPIQPFVSSNERALQAWARRFAGPVTSAIYPRRSGPEARRYDIYLPAPHGMPMGFVIPEGFSIRVWEISRRPHLYSARAAASDWLHVRTWVEHNIMPVSSYRQGNFILAGMWTFGRGGEPFATPTDQAYRDTIVCST